MGKNYCSRYAQVSVDGKQADSKLHKSLLSKIPNRATANLVYAMYMQSGVADAMDAKHQRNTQGQHSADAVLEYFGFQNIMTDISDSSIAAVEKSKGVRDSDGKLHSFQTAKKAFEIADSINNLTDAEGNPLHLAATVVRHDREFQVLVNPISTQTFNRNLYTKQRLASWEKFSHAMGMKGVDMDAMQSSFGDILNMDTSMLNYIDSIANTQSKYLKLREIEFVLSANKNSQLVQNLLQAFNGDMTATVQAVYDNYHTGANPAYAGLIDRALKESRALFQGLDINALNEDAFPDLTAEYTGIKATVDKLNKRYGIDYTEINIAGKRAKSLSEATARAIMVLERRINQLEAHRGTTEETKRLSDLRNKLLTELKNKRYYMGLLEYVNEVHDMVSKLQQDLNSVPVDKTPFENAVALAKVLNNQNIYVDGYTNLFRDLLEDLSRVGEMTIDEALSMKDIAALQENAKAAYNLLKKLKDRGEDLNFQCMMDLCKGVFKDKVSPEVLENVIRTCSSSAWATEALYSFGKLSDPISAAIGDMVRTAQDKRDRALQEITVRIREITDKLYKSGSNSEFMYEDDGHIISDYDWKAYYKARTLARKSLKSMGLTDYALQEAMEQWEENNTEDLIVNYEDGRTERVPKLSLYRKSGPSVADRLNEAQLAYYNEMMKIKGEIGSLLPEWAQCHFLPPQLRRDLVTAATHAHKDGMKKFAKAFKDKLDELYKVKEDDIDWGMHGEREVSYAYARGDLSGRRLQQIPIFFVRKLSNSDELFKNFSAGLQALAATAENYAAMSDIVDVAEFMRTYLNNNTSTLTKNGKTAREVSGDSKVAISSNVTQKGQNSMSMFVLNNMFDRHFYGEHIKDNPFFAKMVGHYVSYTSFKGLSTNVFGGVANFLVGEQQLAQMAVANTLYKVFTRVKQPYFGIADWMTGIVRLFGAPLEAVASAVTGKNTPSVILDLITNNKQSKDYLLAEYFNLFNENYGSMMHTKYHKGFRQLLHDISFIMYGAGEKAIRYNALWAMCRNKKLFLDNKKIDLRQAFTVDRQSKRLRLLSGLSDARGELITDENGKLTEFGRQFMDKFTKDLRYCCQGMFGAMNDEDKGIIHNYAIGRATMNFRQWMVGHYSERFRGIHWDTDKQEMVRGYWTSSGRYLLRSLTTEESRDLLEHNQKVKFMGQFIKDLVTFRTNFIKEWTQSTDTQRLDLMRLMSSVVVYALVFGSACLVGGGMVPKLWMGDEEDEKDRKYFMDPFQKFMYYQLKRLLFDAESSAPLGAFLNAENLIKSPIPALRTFDNSLYFITGLKDIDKILESGPDAGMNKYLRNILKYNLPFWRDFRRLQEFPESDAVFGMFESDNLK